MKLKLLLPFLIFFQLIHLKTKASHFVGSEISYTATTSPNVYLVTFKYLRDCQGIPVCNCPPGPMSSSCSIQLQITGGAAPCLGTSFGTATLTIQPAVSGYDIVQLCALSKTVCSNCGTRTPGSFAPGVEIYTFQGTVNLAAIPPSCCTVNVGFSDCCRNSAITTLVNPSSLGYYNGFIINKCAVSYNNSATFNSQILVVMASGVDQQIDVSASDPDGDSLSYHFAPARTAFNTSAPYSPPYSPTVPFPYLGAPQQSPPLLPPLGINLDPVSGFLRFRPLGNFVSNLVIEVKEWKKVNGAPLYVGSVFRDYQLYSTLVGSNATPNLKIYDNNGVLEPSADQITEYICPGKNLCKTIVATDANINDTTDITISRPSFSSSSTFSFTRLYDTLSRATTGPRFDSVKICWQPSIAQTSTGAYVLSITGSDRVCNIRGKKSMSLVMFIDPIPQAKINNKVTGLLSRKLTYSKTARFKSLPAQTLWGIESSPNSNNFTYINADSLNYNFPSAGLYKIRLGLVTDCNTQWFADSFQVGGFKVMVVDEKSNTCKNASNGSIKLAAVGGTTPYQFKINNGTYSSIDSFVNLPAGNYWCVARDAANIRDSTLVTIYEPAVGMSLFIKSKKDLLCFGDSNGTIDIGVSNSSGALQYKMGTGAFQDSSKFAGIKAGTYLFTVTDASGCFTSSNFSLIQPNVLSLTNTSSALIACKGDSTGSVNLLASGGVVPYTYRLITDTSYTSTFSFGGLPAGIRTYQVKDYNGCLKNTTVNITEPAQKLIANPGITQPICSYSKGSILISANGGTLPYTYGIVNGQSGSSANIANLNAGTYNVYVKDSNNCQINFSPIVINNPPANGITLSFTKKNAGCFGSATGELKLSGSGGKRPYTFKIDTLSYRNDSLFTGIFAGLHQMFVKDSNGCVSLDTTTITQSPSMTLSVSSFGDVTCKGDSNGSVFLLAGGGKTPYVYRIDSGNYQSSPSFTGLKAGIRYLQVRDSNACIKTLNYTINEPNMALSSTVLLNQPNCNLPKGQAVFSAIGGTPPYLYGIVNGASGSSSTINNINPGTYTLYVKDDNNCQVLLPNRTILQAPPTLTYTYTKKNAFCNGSATGEINISGTGGKSPYTYRINAGSFQSDSTFKNLTAGKYRISIRDSVACLFNDSITISQNAAINIQVSGTNRIICKGDSNASISIAASNGLGSYLYKINDDNFQSNPNYNQLKAGLKTIQVKDSANCIATLNYNISEPAVALSMNAQVIQALCSGDKSAINILATGGNQPYSYSINNGSYSSVSSFTNLLIGTYTVQLKDSNQCIITTSKTIQAPISELKIQVVKKDISCFGLNNGELKITASGGKRPYQFKLNNGVFSSDSNFTSLSSGPYNITVRDSAACLVNESKSIDQANKITSTLSAIPASCFGAKNGSARIQVSGGKAPYKITWYSNPIQTGNVAVNLESGIIKVSVEDSNSCITNDSIIVPYIPAFGDENICAATFDSSQSRYRLDWNKTSGKGIASYKIYRGNTVVAQIPFSNNSKFIDTGFSLPLNGIAPSYFIQSVDSCGMSSNLSEETKPILLSSNIGSGSINLTWTPYTGNQIPVSYYVYRKIGNGSSLAVYQTNSSNLNYTDTFSGTNQRTYLIEANFLQSCASGVKVQSNPIRVFANSIDEVYRNKLGFVLYPNPGSSVVNIANKKGLAEIRRIEVTDLSGKIIEQQDFDFLQSEIKLDIQHYANGSYFVILILDNGMKVNLPLQKRL